MKAWILHDINDLRFEDTEKPVPGPGEVLIRVKAAGVCGSDIPRIYKTGAHNMPLIPGHEFSGIVESTGKRVGIYPLIPCGKCMPCNNSHPETCRDYDYTGSRRDGAFAEYVTVPVSNIRELPDNVSFRAAAMLEPMAVAVHAMRMAMGQDLGSVSRDSKTVVWGLGTIGLLLTMFLTEAGFKEVYVCGNKDRQREMVRSLGLNDEHFFDSRSGDTVRELRKKTGGADVFFECVGKNECVTNGIEVSEPGGRIVLLGNPYSDMGLSRDTYWKILRNQLTVMGTWNSTFLPGNETEEANDDWSYVLNKLKEKKVDPERFITQEYGIEDLYKGLEIMRDKTEYFCKVMMTL